MKIKLSALFVLVSLQLLAQTPTFPKRNLVKMNLISPVISSLSFGYERVMNDITTIQVSLFYFNRTRESASLTSGFGITPEVRLYLSDRKTSPAGFFVAPYVTYQNVGVRDFVFINSQTSQTTEQTSRLRMYGVGIIIGGQWIFKDIVSLDIWGGPGYFGGSLKDDNLDIEPPFPFRTQAGFGGRLGCTLGFIF
ncbi:MAG: DUF3575 domain-containing protein [Microscillaceae bacterium]|jgi:hypothetical protein|nr:DUF3575 domain-containing protein [Microscillaceae bacterium]